MENRLELTGFDEKNGSSAFYIMYLIAVFSSNNSVAPQTVAIILF